MSEEQMQEIKYKDNPKLNPLLVLMFCDSCTIVVKLYEGNIKRRRQHYREFFCGRCKKTRYYSEFDINALELLLEKE